MDVDLLKKDVYKDEIYCKELLLNMIRNEEIPVSIYSGGVLNPK
jgi:hypothetical protein